MQSLAELAKYMPKAALAIQRASELNGESSQDQIRTSVTESEFLLCQFEEHLGPDFKVSQILFDLNTPNIRFLLSSSKRCDSLIPRNS